METQGGGSSETIQIQLLRHLAILLLDTFQKNVNQDHEQISTLTLTVTAALVLTAKIYKQRKKMWYMHVSICIYTVTGKQLLLDSYDIFKTVTLMNGRSDS